MLPFYIAVSIKYLIVSKRKLKNQNLWVRNLMASVSVIILPYPISEHKEQREVRTEDINSEKE
jgi:hypothetical protein